METKALSKLQAIEVEKKLSQVSTQINTKTSTLSALIVLEWSSDRAVQGTAKSRENPGFASRLI